MSTYSRRDLARLALMGIPVGAIAAACSRSQNGGTATPTTVRTTPLLPTTGAPSSTASPSTAPPTTAAIDPATPWWLQGNYAPIGEQIEVFDLTVRGALPPTLDGLYVRNGSNPINAPSSHWFFGDGMVHGIRLEKGKAAWYRNRQVDTPLYQTGSGFGGGPPGGASNQSNVSTVWHGGQLLTSGEVGFPFRLSTDDLSTIGVHDYNGALTGSFTAHPKIDPATGRMHAFGYGFFDPFLQYYVIEPDGTMSTVEPVSIPQAVMVHDFAITDRDAIFWDLPVVFDLDLAVQFVADPQNGPMPFVWKPDAGARVGVMPLEGGSGNVQWFELDPCYVFHGVNAFRRGDEVVVDVCRLTAVFEPNEVLGGKGSLRRWTLNTATGTVTDDVLETDDPGDLPTRDPRLVGRDYRYGYMVGTRDHPDTIEFGGVIKHDFRNDSRVRWDPGPTRHAGEPLFVPDGSDTADDAGWVLTYLHDDATNESTLAVFDASSLEAGPVAEVVMPQRVPYGFHGSWLDAAEL
jgi:carotenoid cleavage dioxygenase-like enzyme